MYTLPATKKNVKHKNNINKCCIEYVDTRLTKYQLAFYAYDIATHNISMVPSAVRGNYAYTYQRQTRYNAIQDNINALSHIDKHHAKTNAFFITGTYSTPQANPPQRHIATLRRVLKRHGVKEVVLTYEAHLSSNMHIHAVIITDQQHKYRGIYDKQRKKTIMRCDNIRRIVRKCWPHGIVDIEAITEPAGAGRYIMKELLKQSQCETAIKKYNKGQQLEAYEIKQIYTLYFGMKHRRRLLSVSRKMSAMTKKEQAQAQEEQDESAALFKLSNNSTEGNGKILFRLDKLQQWSIYGIPPPYLTGKLDKTGVHYPIMLKYIRENILSKKN